MKILSLASLVAAMGLWWMILPAIDPDRMTDLGLVSILPLQFYGAMALLAAGFALALSSRSTVGLLPVLHIVGLVSILHATPALVYGTLRYSWAWKHLGIVDYIQRHGAVDRIADYLSVYHNWPTLFLVTAWLCNLLGLNSLDLSYIVRFTPVVLNLGFVATLILIYRHLCGDSKQVMTAAWIFVVGNWVGQDYFSPQGVTFLFYLLLLALFLGPLRRDTGIAVPERLGIVTRVWASAVGAPSMWQYYHTTGDKALATVTALILIAAIVSTHQLTPLLVILATGGLALIGRLSPGFLLFAIIGELAWTLYFAAPFVATHLISEIAQLGEIAGAVGQMADTSIMSPDRVWVVWVGRTLSATIVVAAAIGGLRRLARGYRDGTAIVLSLVPFPLVIIPYGGEILFRAYLFALPMLAFFAASMLFPRRDAGRAIASCFLAVLAFLGAIAFLFANNGKDREYWFAPDEIETAHWLYSTAPAGSLLIEGARSYPSQFLNYENFTYVPISEEDADERAGILADPVGVLERWLNDDTKQDAYFIITRSQKAYLEAQGIVPVGSLAEIEKKLLASPHFMLAKASPNALVFKLNQHLR
ncbi:hypothetical protein [Pseudaminobacter soli (ex Li et al. 2025)]|uniref:Glycosyltransferase RgtA/B/C/D-like domain-containing protein n=1 Tax=Pseudaminobacter soli (ex Li et al. 2025) TaxID=1295366 RepID=A0A2P7RU79_9HYPH|nr:hypothetical protein [Mesorhizobium soli]PSJ53781.1 hypothetical protein C7I85_27830 [Mesorhizobium soli]